MARCAGGAHPVGGGCGSGPIAIHVTAIRQQAVRRVGHRVLVQSGRHSRVAAAYCAKRVIQFLFTPFLYVK
jgi:hypothetical protein